MSRNFIVGDKVRWNSEVGHVTGKIVSVHTSDTEFLGRTRRASPEAPQYQVESDKTGHRAMHKEEALEKID